MCKPRNQTIYRECFEKLRKLGYQTNFEIRQELAKRDGCMMSITKLDKDKTLAIR